MVWNFWRKWKYHWQLPFKIWFSMHQFWLWFKWIHFSRIKIIVLTRSIEQNMKSMGEITTNSVVCVGGMCRAVSWDATLLRVTICQHIILYLKNACLRAKQKRMLEIRLRRMKNHFWTKIFKTKLLKQHGDFTSEKIS